MSPYKFNTSLPIRDEVWREILVKKLQNENTTAEIKQPHKAKFHYAIQSQTRWQTWTQACVCVSCACHRPAESWSTASCNKPVCDQVRAIMTNSNKACRDGSNLSATCFRPNSIMLSKSQTWSQTWLPTWRSTSLCKSATSLRLF